MAVKYFADFSDDDGRNWHIVIHDQNYGGSSPVEFTVGRDGFVLNYEGSDTQRSQTIQTSTLEFDYILQNNNDNALLSAIAGSAEGRYQVEVYAGGATYSAGHLYWRGVILADISQIKDQAYPQEFKIVAIDDLAGLKELPFETTSTGYSSIAGIVANCLNKMRVWDITSDTHRFTTIQYIQAKDHAGTYVDPFLRGELNYAEFEDTDKFPTEYKPTYEVLENIVSGLGMRMYWKASSNDQENSGFFIDSINLQTYSNIQYTPTQYNNVGTATSPGFQYRQQITLDTDKVHRLRGWTHGYANPLLKVTRDFTYGSSPFVVDHEYSGNSYFANFHDGSYAATLMTAPTVQFGEDSLISLRFNLRSNHLEGNDSSVSFDTLAKRAGRLRVRATLRFGQYYADRNILHTGTINQYVSDGDGQCPILAFQELPPTWETSSSSYITWYSPPIVWTDEENLTFAMGIDMPPLPADLTSETCTVAWEIKPVVADATVNVHISACGALYQQDQANILKATIYPTDIFESAGATTTFIAENNNTDAREILKLPETYFSDLVGTRGGGLFINNGTRIQPSQWQSATNQAADLNLHNLVAREWLEGQSTNIRKMSGQVRVVDTAKYALSLGDTITHDSVQYNIQMMRYVASRGQYQLELLELSNSGTITNPPVTFSDGYDNVVNEPGRPPVSPVETIIGGIAEKTDNITVTQAVDLDAIESGLTAVTTVIKSAFSGGGAGIYVDSGKATNKSYVGLTETGATVQAGTGNTSVTLDENSPGVFEVNVQDSYDNSQLAIRASADLQGAKVGIGTSTLSSKLTVAGVTDSTGYRVNGSLLSLTHLNDVTTSGVQTDQVLAWNGSNFVPVDQSGGGGGSGDTSEVELKMFFLEQ